MHFAYHRLPVSRSSFAAEEEKQSSALTLKAHQTASLQGCLSLSLAFVEDRAELPAGNPRVVRCRMPW